MRTSSVITISLPPAMAKISERLAQKRHMTRSEFMRTALRHYLAQSQYEETAAMTAIQTYEREKRVGALKTLKGSLSDLIE